MLNTIQESSQTSENETSILDDYFYLGKVS